MRSNECRVAFAAFAIAAFLVNCSKGVVTMTSSRSGAQPQTNDPKGPTLSSTTQTPTPTPTQSSGNGTSNNVMAVTVNGSLCGDPNYQYSNEPCVSVTICSPGTSNCQTINNILLDTGSYGLRIFQSVITVNLTPVTSGSAQIAECVQYGDNSSQWGPIEWAEVQLGNEPAVRVPIEVINSTFAKPPSLCTAAQSNPDTDPQNAGFNGILGVGLFAQDCGDYCANNANPRYYACTGSGSSANCAETAVSNSNQVQNPVALLPVDNNGVILKLPSVGPNGASYLDGSLILGIGTQANNSTSGVTPFTADGYGHFKTQFSSFSASAVSSFIDSGSSALFIPTPTNGSLPDCGTSAGGNHGQGYGGFFCPSSPQNLTATNISASGSPNGNVSFQISNAYNLFNNTSNNAVFMNVGDSSGTDASATFDWGLPFFFGKSVYVGIQGKQSQLGTGPYWAY